MDKEKDRDRQKDSEGDGKSGRIGRLDEQTLGYYRRVADTLSEGFDSPADKELMLDNVFHQLCEEATRVCQNQTASHIVESLLREASPHHLLSFANSLGSDWELACTDRFACYVTQTLIMRIAEEGKVMKSQKFSQDQRPVSEILGELYQFLMGNAALHMQHTYASHILRTFLEVMAGVRVNQEVIRSKISRQQQNKDDVTKDFYVNAKRREFAWQMCDKIVNMMMLKGHAENALANPVLQTVMLVAMAMDPQRGMELCRTLIQNTRMFEAEGSSLPDMVTHEVGSHLVEQVISMATADMYSEIVSNHLERHLVQMALHPKANYIVQRLLSHATTPEQLQPVYHPLKCHIEDLFAYNHFGVVTKLADACCKHHHKQEKLVKALLKAFHCYKPVERQTKCVPLIASLTTYDVFYKQTKGSGSDESSDDEEEEVKMPLLTKLNYHGCVLLQSLLKFDVPRLVVQSLLDLRPVELQRLACDPCGSHVIDAFVTSETVSEKSRLNLYPRLKGLYVSLACDKNGSRSLDTLWKVAPVKQRTIIADDLSSHEHRLRGDRFGGFAWRNFGLQLFKQRPNDWKDVQSRDLKKRRIFNDMLPESKPVKGTKRPIEEDTQVKNEHIPETNHHLPDSEIDANSNIKKKKQKKKHKELLTSEKFDHSTHETEPSSSETSITKGKKKKKPKT